jgi:acyl carrier protein
LQFPTLVTDSLVDEVQALVRTFSPKVASVQTDLLGTGILDSANLVRLVFAVEAQFDVAIPLEELDLDSIRSIASIANLVRELQSTPAPALTTAAAATAEPDLLIRQIHEMFVNTLSVEIPSPDVDLFKAGLLDSMLLVQLIMLLEDQFGLNLSLEDLDVAAFSTTTGIAQLVRHSRSSRAV